VNKIKSTSSLVVALLFLVGLFFLQNQTRSLITGGAAIVPLPSQYLGTSIRPEVIRRFLGIRILAADLVWIDTLLKADIQHEGKPYTDVYRSFKTIFELDPDNLLGLHVAGIYLSVIKDDSKGAVAILSSGIETIEKHRKLNALWKNAWGIPFLLGFTLMFEEHEFLEGAKWVRLAAREENAPKYVRGLANVIKDNRGVYESAGRILSDLLEKTQREDEKDKIRKKLEKIFLQSELSELNQRFDFFLGRIESKAPKKIVLRQFLRENGISATAMFGNNKCSLTLDSNDRIACLEKK